MIMILVKKKLNIPTVTVLLELGEALTLLLKLGDTVALLLELGKTLALLLELSDTLALLLELSAREYKSPMNQKTRVRALFDARVTLLFFQR